ncbi:hypothetical protein [Microbacterium testaceum]|uniref:alginate O-acetyltransferase AlgX-related protein n=1 Tax=Microbacterium testaceum TaxID=2033 RepID=UPI0037F3FA13
MTAGTALLPPGQELKPGRRWWRRLRYIPFIALVLLSVTALLVGVVTKADIERRVNQPASVVSSTTDDDPAARACRPAMPAYDKTPWWEDEDARESVWSQHTSDVAQPYLIGPNGWVFWSDQVDQYASQAVGRTHLTEPEVTRWIDHFKAVRDGLARDGVEFYVIVTPSTSSVYPEELPEWMQQTRGATSLDQLMAAADDLPLIDVRSDLIAQKTPATHLFSWDNSHWTDFGAYSSWGRIADCVNTFYPDGQPLRTPAVSGSKVIGDFNEWASYGVPSPGADWSAPVYDEPLQDVTRTGADGKTELVPGDATTDAGTLPIETTVGAPWTGKSALIFRDSMGGGLSPLWQQSYSPTWQMWHRYRAGFEDPESYRQYVEQYHPDVVIVQLAERHLINTPAPGAGY